MGKKKKLEKKRLEKKNKIILAFKVLALGSLFSPVFGLGFQKGMIVQMGFGNLSGNYDIRELLNSTIFGAVYVFNRLADIEPSLSWRAYALLLGFSVLFGVSIQVFRKYIKNKADREKENKSKAEDEAVKQTSLKEVDTNGIKKAKAWLLEKIKSSSDVDKPYSKVAGIGAIYGFFLAIVIGVIDLLTKSAFLTIFSLILVVSVFGYFIGISYINTESMKPVCLSITEEIVEENDVIFSCPKIKIKDRQIKAKVELETPEGYFLRRNSSYAFVSKDGTRCMVIKRLVRKKDGYKKVDDIDFKKIDTELDNFCNMVI